MGRRAIEKAFERARTEGRLAFVPYLTAGDPDLDRTVRFAEALARAGADILELGVPWSDPLADGPVNQRAAERALAAGTTLGGVLEAAPEIKARAGVPLVLFTYVNPLLRLGLERFAVEAARAGVDGVLTTDLPPEEAASYCRCLGAQELATIFLATPTSHPARLREIGRASTGFVYTVARTGVTGPETAIEQTLRETVRRVREASALPVAVGFGIRKPEQVARLRGLADGFVVGTALVELIERSGGGEETCEALVALASSLRAAGSLP